VVQSSIATGPRRGHSWVFTCLSLLLLLGAIPAAQAQLTPSVDIECSPVEISVEVAPGTPATGTTTCTLTNDYFLPEEVNITVDVVDLVYAAPETVTVSANSDTTFQVVYRAELGDPVKNIQSDINALVESAGGLPCLSCTEETFRVTVAIQQYGRPGLLIDPQELLLDPGQSGEIVFKVQNKGNDKDTITLDVVNRSGLEQFGVQFSFSGSSFELNADATADVTLTVTTTKEVGGGIFEVEITATSQHSVDEGNAWTINDVFRLETVAKQELILSVAGVPTWAVSVAAILLLLAVVGAIVVVVKLVSNRRSLAADDFDFDDDDIDFDDDDFDDLDLDDLDLDDL